MPFVHLNRDPRLTPGTPFEIDWDHPLAKGLSGGMLFNLDGGPRAFDCAGNMPVSEFTQNDPASGYTVHNGRRCYRQAYYGRSHLDYITITTGKLPDNAPASMSVGAAHERSVDAATFQLLSYSGAYTGGWYIVGTNTPKLSCQMNSGNGFGIFNTEFPEFDSKYHTTGEWFNLSLAYRQEATWRLRGTFNQGVEREDNQSGNAPSGAFHKEYLQLFRRDWNSHYYWTGWCSHIYFWNGRYLDQDERSWINAEPFDFVRTPQERIYFDLTAGGGASVTPALGSRAISGQAVTVAGVTDLTPGQGAIVAAGQAAIVQRSTQLTAGTGTSVASGYNVDIIPTISLYIGNGTTSVSGHSVDVTPETVLDAIGAGAIVLSGQPDPSVGKTTEINPPAGAVFVAGMSMRMGEAGYQYDTKTVLHPVLVETLRPILAETDRIFH